MGVSNFSLKAFLRDSSFTKNVYQQLKKARDTAADKNKLYYHGQFVNRIKGSETACIVLAGYKEFFYPALFGRLEKFAPSDMDICVVSSGKYSGKLDEICEKNGWSYLSTKENNVALVQNIAIHELKNAKYIFKLDEDILITEGYFEKIISAYEHSKNEGEYIPGIMAPLIPINGYAHLRILEKLGLKEEYKNRFEKPLYASGPDRRIENDPETAKFFWGEGGFVPGIDEMNHQFGQEAKQECPCPVRFSIGAIMFEREFFEKFGYFKVDRSYSQLGDDEAQLCAYCCINSRPIMVSENVVVGHLSFGPQNKAMREYYEMHPEHFLQ